MAGSLDVYLNAVLVGKLVKDDGAVPCLISNRRGNDERFAPPWPAASTIHFYWYNIIDSHWPGPAWKTTPRSSEVDNLASFLAFAYLSYAKVRKEASTQCT
jgi:hypothetical protein